MPVITSLRELDQLREETQHKRLERAAPGTVEIIIMMGSCGIAAGAENTRQAFLDLIEDQGVAGVTVKITSCIGRCGHEPIVQVLRGEQSNVFYGNVDPSAAKKIMKQHIRDGQPVKEYMIPL